ncbi:hypothetical protein F5X98DRAFT_3499 [Xylaria grammica]|nr:hypothetical protein F5X98DRAFT_3499 [Xylaria grammica]
MERKRLFWVPVRDYRLLHTKSLVQSPHINLEAKVPRVIIRAIDGEYVGEPRVIDDAAALADDINGKIYSHAAHGVCVSLESHADGFPVWVCLKRNEHCQENHVWVLNLFNSEFLVVPIANICWVPSHEAADGGLYTIIGDPGKHGYQGSYLPAVTQELDLPRRAKLCLLPTDLPGFKRLEARRQQELFDRQYLNMKKDSEKCPKPDRLSLQCLRQPEQQQQQPHAAVHGISKLPAFCEDPYSDEERASPLPLNQIGGIQGPVPEGYCRCFFGRYPDLGPTCLDPTPLHQHIMEDQCSLGSMHTVHCAFAAHRPEHCVIGGSTQGHTHCVTGGTHSPIVDPPYIYGEHQAGVANTGVDWNDATETELQLGGYVDEEYFHNELELFPGHPSFLDDQVMQTSLFNLDAPVPYPELI